jgi:hypothetical protein
MKNNQIIFETVRNTFTPSQLDDLVNAIYTPEQIAARRAAVEIVIDGDSDETPESIITAEMAAETFHTFAEWKRLGYSVKKGQHATLKCFLGQYTEKPSKAAQQAAAEAGSDTPEADPHYYKKLCHLFNALQVEKISK